MRMVVGNTASMPMKPNRSEELGTLEEQKQRSLEVQHILEANAPKRPLKPARSDAADQLSMSTDDAPFNPPEYQNFQELESHSTLLATSSSGLPSEDYAESDYYNCMGAIDKQHHTTGTGFIKVIDTSEENFHLSNDPKENTIRQRHPCNPAMNDWVPTPDTTAYASTKPLRSELL